MALVERGGDVGSFPVDRVTVNNIKPILKQHIDPSTHLVTDEHVVCYFMKDEFPKHSTVNHPKKEYARKEGDFSFSRDNCDASDGTPCQLEPASQLSVPASQKKPRTKIRIKTKRRN